MKRETQRRIRAYQRALPAMQAKVFGAIGTLVFSIALCVTASFAWMVISRSPELSSVTTTIASNGALEIALVEGDGSQQPLEYDIDESVGISHDVTVTNVLWGNLINISDARYGIDDLVLRPAQLNVDSLTQSPLYGALYGNDGRISDMISDFAYAMWDGSSFLTSRNYGVRAIATYTEEISDTTTAQYNQKKATVIAAHNAVNNKYVEIREAFSSIAGLLQTYAQDKLDDNTNPGSNLAPKIQSLLNVYKVLTEAMELQKQAYVTLADFQLYMDAQSRAETYTALTWDQIAADKAIYNAATPTAASTNGVVSLSGLNQFIADYNSATADYAKLKQYSSAYKNNGTPLYWGTGGASGYQLNDIVMRLVQYNSMYIWYNGTKYVIVNLNSDSGMALMNKTADVYTTDGILKRFEQIAVDNDYRLNGKSSCNLKLSYSILSFTVGGYAYTEASGKPDVGTGPVSAYFSTDYNTILNKKLVANDQLAEDTYGMAVDFWIRSNAEVTTLTLEGALVTENDGTILRYDGVNRIWGSTGNANLTTNSTTQGGGSCYVYYADTPEDQSRSLALLDSMKVAFVDSTGHLLATADMDTEKYYAINGRVTVPLKLNESYGVKYTYKDETNTEKTATAITKLYLDQPQRITAIIYLDGTTLENDSVLAAADIDGQLNLQFGSSDKLNTVGDNELEVAERSVSATLSRYSMDYADKTDNLTTQVTVKVDGAQPSTMTAFFQRAVTATQGQRQEEMTFVKQADGTWTSEYTFTKPGNYYLRYIRMDGVDFPLGDPQKVEVDGYTVSNIAWGEAANTKTVYSVDNSYAEYVSVEFASNDPTTMPKTVSARFVRTDGNVVTANLKYNPTKQKWEGTATFATSGTYELQFLVIDYGTGAGYTEVESGMRKNITLFLGLSATVENNGSSTNDMYDAEADPTVYAKNVRVHIYDNAGVELKDLGTPTLRYGIGGSSNSIPAQLTWNEAEEAFLGVLPITKPGRWSFSSISVNGNTLTKATEAQVFVIVSPDPPTYDATSESHYHSEVQFAPMTNDAYIGPVNLNDAASASVSAVVHNSITDQDYVITQSNEQNKNGTIYYDGDNWYINLPIYTLDVDADGEPLPDAVWTQEGTWTVKKIAVWDCYDSASEFRGEDDPLVWLDAADENIPNAEITYFGGLSTTVSCSINVAMEAGDTTLGSSSDPFMKKFTASNTGMYITLLDDSGRVIPADKISDITLNVGYTDNTDADTYGYTVSGYTRVFPVKLNTLDTETGRWNISEDYTWEYVGRYAVNNLVVTTSSGNKITVASGENGVPEAYTITTAGPSANNLKVVKLSQSSTVFGKTGENVNGTFMQSYNPGISAQLSLQYTDENGETKEATFARVDGVSLSLNLAYKGGSSANGGYTWSGSSSYENITIPMNNTVSGSYVYNSGATPLLAGKYGVTGTISVGSSSNSLGTLSDINVYSKTPTIKVTGVNPAPSQSVTINANASTDGTEYLWTYAELYTVNNYYEDYSARVYMMAEADDTAATVTAKYTAPKITLALSDLGTGFNTANFNVLYDASKYTSASFTPSTTTAEMTIGNVEKKTYTDAGGCGGEDVSYSYYIKSEVGDKTINTITVTDAYSTQYTVNLAHEISISQKSDAPPSISFVSAEGYTVPSAQQSPTGASFSYTLPSSIGTTSKETQKAKSASGWGSPVSDTVVGKYAYCSKTSSPTQNKVTSGCTTTTYYYCTFTYSQYERHQYVYEKEDGFDIYQATYGLTGWQVGDTVYAPGATITVSSATTATPIIGQLSEVYLRSETSTYVHTTQKDISKGTSTSTGNKTATTSKTDCTNQKYMACPSGYNWFNTTTYTDKGDLNTTEHQVGEDYKKN